LSERFVEASNAAESSRECDFGHWHISFVNQLLRQQHSPSLRDCYRRGSEVLLKESTQMTLAYAQSRCKRINVGMIQGAHFDQRQRP
jgi:hypothetical protein